MAQPSYIYKNDALARHQKASIDLVLDTKGLKFVGAQPQNIIGIAATPFTQTAIDALLGSTNEFLSASFGATGMGIDALAFIINCDGQIKSVAAVELLSLSDTTEEQQLGGSAAIANTLAAVPRVECSSLGNVAVQCVITGLDAATTGLAVIRIHCELK
jgi:hypothetical protein